MRYDTGEFFSYSTVSAAATCSFTLTASTRNIMIENIVTYSDLSNAVVDVMASSVSIWSMNLGSAAGCRTFPGLTIDGGACRTLSCNITGTATAAIAVCGRYRQL